MQIFMNTLQDVEAIVPSKETLLLVKNTVLEEVSIAQGTLTAARPRAYEKYFVAQNAVYGIKKTSLYCADTNEAVATIAAAKAQHLSSDSLYEYAIDAELQVLSVTRQPLSCEEENKEAPALTKRIEVSLDGKTNPNLLANGKAFLFSGNLLYIEKNRTISVIDLHTGEEKLLSSGLKITVCAICETETYVVLGTSTGSLVTINRATLAVQQTIWHAHPIALVTPVAGNLVVSLSVRGVMLFTDCNTLSNSYVANTVEEVESIKVSSSGHLICLTTSSVQVYDLSSRILLYKIYLLSKTSKTIATESLAHPGQTYTPSFSTAPTKPSPTLSSGFSARSKTTTRPIENGAIYLLKNMLLFTNTEQSVYKVLTQLSTIQNAFYSNGHVLLTVNKAEEEIRRHETSTPETPETLDPALLYKVYKVNSDTFSLLWAGELPDVEESATILSVSIQEPEKTVITLLSPGSTTPHQRTSPYPLDTFFEESF
ncbi:hypothetical protein NEDG_00391 [Nematocida displodere]|uniref:Uncharacterized protein n=1 Tax=Nematocida displodere TaxID=1805483 RepID=A0A177EJP8_9MICR|nr:hypothetical protein NEDG_00391 [Nematocida displodere]